MQPAVSSPAGECKPTREKRPLYGPGRHTQSSTHGVDHAPDRTVPHLRGETVNLPRTSTGDLPQELLGSDIYGLRPISSGRLFFYTMTTDDVMLRPPQSQFPPSLKNIVGPGKVRDISVSQFGSAALWLLTGFVEFGDSPIPTTRQEGHRQCLSYQP